MPNMYTVMHACIAHSCSALDVPLGLPWAPSGRRSDYMVSCLAMAHKAPQHSAMVACTVKSNIEQCYDINKMRLEQCYDINSALRAQHSDIALFFYIAIGKLGISGSWGSLGCFGPADNPLGGHWVAPFQNLCFFNEFGHLGPLGSVVFRFGLVWVIGAPLGASLGSGAELHSPE